jgi:acyl CoA:acetate/3-ketoacid CoA transferase beta subunit
MDHNAKDGAPKIVNECDLPLTGKEVVDMIITELGVFSIENGKLRLIELAPDVQEAELRDRTDGHDITVTGHKAEETGAESEG